MEVKYDKIGVDYNLTRKADPYLTEQLFHHLSPKPNGLYLDIGCGTGNYTIELQKKGIQLIGIDPSIEMLEKAKIRNQQIDWRVGSSENTKLNNNSVDGIIGSLTIHHWENLENGFSELYRVLKPNGKVVIFTSTPEQMKGYWLNHYFPQMLYDSIVQMPALEEVKNSMECSGIKLIETALYSIKPDLKDQFLYCGKQNPELYFDENIRQGISSFSSLSNKEEVEKGLIMLRQDIDERKINRIMEEYQNNLGDYLYIIGRKPASNNI